MTAAPAPLAIAEQGQFHVGGQYTRTADGEIMVGQMYVQYQVPADRRHPFPVVMIHGGGQTASNFLGTPDGRPGWADWFLRAGYAVYVVDQAARARSGYYTDVYGPTRRPTTAAMASRFTATARNPLWPQAHLHTQWPGAGVPGDPVFDRFFASQVEDIADVAAIERYNRAAGTALLDRIGPAVLLTHSQSGPIGWGIADARPALVKGIVAIEPSGPPFHNVQFTGAPGWFADGPAERPWGITAGPLTYDPPAASAADLAIEQEAAALQPDLVRGRLQRGTPRRLVRLQGIPILIVTGEASYHAAYDHCTVRFLEQAGVRCTFTRLADEGIGGNGHMMFLERNNDAIAALLDCWLQGNVGPFVA